MSDAVDIISSALQPTSASSRLWSTSGPMIKNVLGGQSSPGTAEHQSVSSVSRTASLPVAASTAHVKGDASSIVNVRHSSIPFGGGNPFGAFMPSAPSSSSTRSAPSGITPFPLGIPSLPAEVTGSTVHHAPATQSPPTVHLTPATQSPLGTSAPAPSSNVSRFTVLASSGPTAGGTYFQPHPSSIATPLTLPVPLASPQSTFLASSDVSAPSAAPNHSADSAGAPTSVPIAPNFARQILNQLQTGTLTSANAALISQIQSGPSGPSVTAETSDVRGSPESPKRTKSVLQLSADLAAGNHPQSTNAPPSGLDSQRAALSPAVVAPAASVGIPTGTTVPPSQSPAQTSSRPTAGLAPQSIRQGIPEHVIRTLLLLLTADERQNFASSMSSVSPYLLRVMTARDEDVARGRTAEYGARIVKDLALTKTWFRHRFRPTSQQGSDLPTATLSRPTISATNSSAPQPILNSSARTSTSSDPSAQHASSSRPQYAQSTRPPVPLAPAPAPHTTSAIIPPVTNMTAAEQAWMRSGDEVAFHMQRAW